MRPVPTQVEIARHVRDAGSGSQHAYSWLYRQFAPLVHAIHLGLSPAQLADELTQETFGIAFARLPQLREPHLFGAWIARIARRHRPAPGPAAVALESQAEPTDPGTTPEDAAEADRMLRAIQALPEAYRETLMLRLVEGLGGPEIAALTGLTPASVRVNLHRGMARLRAALGLAPGTEEVSDERTA